MITRKETDSGFSDRKTLDFHQRGIEVEILTTDNHADGIYIYNRVKKLEPERANEVVQLLEMHGGCSAGTKFANVDPRGNVHPCQFWQDYTVGNVKETPFSEIWNSEDPLMIMLRKRSSISKGVVGNALQQSMRRVSDTGPGGLWRYLGRRSGCYLSDDELMGGGIKMGFAEVRMRRLGFGRKYVEWCGKRVLPQT